MARLRNKGITCCWCHAGSYMHSHTNNELYQCGKWSTLFYHERCGEEIRVELVALGMPMDSDFSLNFKWNQFDLTEE